jgi:O-antigen ligase
MHHLISLYFLLYLLIRHASEVGLIALALFGVLVLIVPGMRAKAMGSVSGWQRQDTWMVVSITSVFVFKLVSSLWSASPALGISNATWHAHFAVWPFVVVAMLYCKPKLNHVLGSLSAALVFTGLWMLYSIITGKIGYYPLVYKINVGVLAELVLVCGSLLLVAATTGFANRPKRLTVLYGLGVAGAFVILYSTGRRTEWIGFFVVCISLGLWHLRASFNWWRAVLAVLVLAGSCFVLFYLRQDRLMLAYREVVHYFNVLGVDASAAATSVGARLEMYRLGLTAFWHNPVFGMGSGVRPYLLQAYGGLGETQLTHRHFHSEFLQVLVEGGLVWALALSAAISYWFRRAVFGVWKNNEMLALIAAYLSIAFMLAGSISAGLIYGPANATFVMFSALIWVCIRQSGANTSTH